MPKGLSKIVKIIFGVIGLFAILGLIGSLTLMTQPTITGKMIMPEVNKTGETETRDYMFIQTISYKSENTTAIISKNKLTKTATIKMEVFYDSSELKTPLGDMTEFVTRFGCGLMQISFFNKTAIEEFNKIIKEWNSQESTIKDDSPPEEQQTTPEKNPLEGYKIERVDLYFKDKSTKETISECSIIGPSKSDISIKISGKEISSVTTTVPITTTTATAQISYQDCIKKIFEKECKKYNLIYTDYSSTVGFVRCTDDGIYTMDDIGDETKYLHVYVPTRTLQISCGTYKEPTGKNKCLEDYFEELCRAEGLVYTDYSSTVGFIRCTDDGIYVLGDIGDSSKYKHVHISQVAIDSRCP